MRINFTIACIQYSLPNLCRTKLTGQATPNRETSPNSASVSGPSKTTTLNTLFPGAFSRRTRRTTAQAKDVTSPSKKNSKSSADLNYQY